MHNNNNMYNVCDFCYSAKGVKMLSKPFVAARDDLPAEEMQTTEFYP